MQVTTIGLDLAKNVFQVHGITPSEEVVFNRPLRRAQLLPFFSKIEPCLIGMDPQPLLWVGQRHVGDAELIANEDLRPVLIPKGALGNSRDLMVSRQHGMMVGSDHLVRAIHLAREMPGVRIAHGKRKVTYVHLFFARHQIVFAEGIPSESFYPGPEALKMMSPSALSNFLNYFPSLNTPEALRDKKATEAKYGKPARAFAKLSDIERGLRSAA